MSLYTKIVGAYWKSRGLTQKAVSLDGNFISTRTVAEYLSSLGLTNFELDPSKVSLLFTMIDKRGTTFSQVKFKAFNKAGKEIEDHDLITKLKNPNRLQGWKEFAAQYAWYLSVMGIDWVNTVFPEGFKSLEDSQIININPTFLKVPNIGYKEMITNDFPEFIWYDDGKVRTKINMESLTPFWDTTQKPSNWFEGISRSKAGKLIFSNSQLRLEADNTLTGKPGGIGIMSTSKETTSSGLTIPLSKNEKDRLHEELKQYGVASGKRHVILTNASVDYQAMANPFKEWEFSDSNNRDFMQACNLFQIPKELLVSDATYENKQYAMIDYYQGDPLTAMQNLIDGLAKAYGFTEDFEASYDHIPVMQVKKREQAQYLNTYFDALKKAQDLGANEKTINDLVNNAL